MTLYLYFARKFFWTFALVFAVFLGILLLIDMVEQLRKFDSATVGFTELLELALLHIPASLYRILPLITILATLALFLGLARSSELVVTRAAGRSGLRSLVAPVTVALLIGLVAVAAFNPIVAATSTRYEATANRYSHGEASVLSVTEEGLWLRQGGPGGQWVIRAAGSNLDGTRLVNVSFISFAPDGSPTGRIDAQSAELTPGAWVLKSAKQWPLAGTQNPERDAVLHDEVAVPSELTRERIRDSFGTPSAIAIWDLPAFIAALDRAGFSARQHRVWFQMELALPLLLVSMVLVGAGFTMRHTRSGRTGIMVLGAILMGFSLFFIRNFAQILGETGQIPVVLAAWAPPVAAICLALALLLHMEEG